MVMGRPRKGRCCRRYAADRVFKPRGVPLRESKQVLLSLDEFEVLRLCDLERLDQEAAGEHMGVSRGTVQRLHYEAREKLVGGLLNNHAIFINLKNREGCHAGLHPHERKRRSRRHGM